MKNKTKSKNNSKNQVPRPAHKKSRPKKHVEAKIPDLPPIPSEQVPIVNNNSELIKKFDQPSEEKTKDEFKTLESLKKQFESLFEGKITVEQLKKQLEDLLDDAHEYGLLASYTKRNRYEGCVVYTHPGIGLIRRRDFEPGLDLPATFRAYLAEEKLASKKRNDTIQANLQAARATAQARQFPVSHKHQKITSIENFIKENTTKLLKKILNWLQKKIKINEDRNM